MNIEEELVKLSAEMAVCDGMPSYYYEDWDWPKGMQAKSWHQVQCAANKANDKSKEWARRLFELTMELTVDAPNKAMHADSESVPLLEGVDYKNDYWPYNKVKFSRCR